MSGKSELILFSPAMPQVVVESAYFSEILPTTSTQGGGTVIFNIPASETDYLDLNDSFMEITAQIMKGNNQVLETTSPHVLTNHAFYSFYSDIKLLLNDVVVEGGSSTYPYKSVIENMFNFNETTRQIQLKSAGYEPNENERKKWTAESKHCTFVGSLRLDFFNQPLYLLPGVNVKLIMTPAKAKFAVQKAPAGAEPKLILSNHLLHVRRVKVDPGVLLGHMKAFERSNAIYPYDCSKITSFSITKGSSIYTHEPVFPRSVLPKFLIVGMVNSAAYAGDSATADPFKFEHFNVSTVALYCNGQIIPYSKPYEIPGWADESQVRTTYVKSIIHSTQHLGKNDNNGITEETFIKGPNTFFCFNLASDFDYHCKQPLKDGSLRLEIRFAKPLESVESINVVAMGIFDAEIQITKDRVVIPDPHVF